MPGQKISREYEKNKKNLKKFFIALVSIIVIILISIYIFAGSILKDDRDITIKEIITNNLKEKNIIKDIFSPAKSQINFIILGVDEDETRTDLMMIGTFKSKEKSVDIISVPRDIYTQFSEEELQLLKEKDRPIPKNNILKLNEVHNYAGEEMGVDFIVSKIEQMLNVELDYYAKVDIDGFIHLIDEMGGVEFNVPQRMIYYDPVQQFRIDLKPGMQLLDGNQSEGLIRYRQSAEGFEDESPSYPMADLQRNIVQQQFLKAFITQLLQKDKMINNSAAIIDTVNKYITTNFNINEVPKYLKYVKDINTDNIKTYSLPTDEKEVDGNTISYIQLMEQPTKDLIDQIFYNKIIIADPIESINKKIQILNGTSTSGLALNKKHLLDLDGFFVENIDDYETVSKETIITIKKDGMAQDLLHYFPNAEIVIDNKQDYYDIIIVLGE